MKTRQLKRKSFYGNLPFYINCTPTGRWKITTINGETLLALEIFIGACSSEPIWVNEYDLEIEEKEEWINDCSSRC